MKLVIQIPSRNEEATLPATLAELPTRLPGLRRGRVARHRRRQLGPHQRRRARSRRPSRGPLHRAARARPRLRDRSPRGAGDGRRRHRQHRRRQPVPRRRCRHARPAHPRRAGRHGGGHAAHRGHQALLSPEETPAADRERRRAAPVEHRRSGCHQRLPRLRPRGRAPADRPHQLQLHDRDPHPGRREEHRGRARAGPHQREAARVPSVHEHGDLHPAVARHDVPRLHALPAAPLLHLARGGVPGRRAGPVPALLRHLAPEPVPDGPRPVPDRGRRVHDHRRALPGARRAGGPHGDEPAPPRGDRREYPEHRAEQSRKDGRAGEAAVVAAPAPDRRLRDPPRRPGSPHPGDGHAGRHGPAPARHLRRGTPAGARLVPRPHPALGGALGARGRRGPAP